MEWGAKSKARACPDAGAWAGLGNGRDAGMNPVRGYVEVVVFDLQDQSLPGFSPAPERRNCYRLGWKREYGLAIKKAIRNKNKCAFRAPLTSRERAQAYLINPAGIFHSESQKISSRHKSSRRHCRFTLFLWHQPLSAGSLQRSKESLGRKGQEPTRDGTDKASRGLLSVSSVKSVVGISVAAANLWGKNQ